MKGLLICLAMLLSIAGAPDARAEGRCPDGYYPTGGADVGWYGCAPMGPIPSDNGDEGPPQQEDEPGWETRWGAIATADGAFGVANGMTSKRHAESQAMSDCKARSNGKPCKLKTAFYDQCAALAWGDEVNITFRSPDLQDAESSAVQACSKHTSNCKVYYSACSYPQRVQ
jgi:Domain of unknown function (DUF4189)